MRTILARLFGFGILLLGTISSLAQNWALTSAPSNAWTAVAASGELGVIAATTAAGGIYYSTDAGTNWLLSNAPSNNWAAIACSTSGVEMYSVVNGGGIWVSSDSGASWSESSAPTNVWAGIACSADGTKVVATGNGVWYSMDSGNGWTLTSAPTNYWAGTANYGPVSSSADGSQFVLGQTGAGGSVWLSADAGTNWTRTMGGFPWSSFASSSDGEILVGVSYDVSISTDFGADWYWSLYGVELGTMAASSDCSKIVCVSSQYSGLSADTGRSWRQFETPNEQLAALALSADGNKLIAVANGGGVYIWQDTVPVIASEPVTQTAPIGGVVEFTVGAFTVANPNYQWLFNRDPIPNATNAILTLTNIQPNQTGAYTVLVSNSFGSALSSNAMLTVVPALLSTSPPIMWPDGASLMGTVTTAVNGTLIWFDWGLNTYYGGRTSSVLIGAAQDLAISNLLVGLTSYTTYHYQIVASNQYGIAYGGDTTFSTSPVFVQVGTNIGWSALAISGDGSELAATLSNTIYVSTNLGQTFVPTAGNGAVFGLSSNGAIILSGIASAFVVSTNRGATWVTNAAPGSFGAFAASSSGNVIVGTVVYDSSGTLYLSTDLGKNWYKSMDPGVPSGLACSTDGTYIYGTCGNAIRWDEWPGFGYLSTNFGTTWNTFATPEVQNSGIICSGNGSVVVVGGELGTIVSTNYGIGWGSGMIELYDVALSGDGKTIIASGPGNAISVSPDSGASWFAANAPSAAGRGMVMTSGDGSVLAALSGGAIYLSMPQASKPFQLSATTGVSQGLSALSLSGQTGYTYFVQASTDLISWTNVAVLVATNSKVTISDPDSTNYNQRFYRVVAP